MKVNWTSVGATAVSAIGVLSSPHILSLLPEKWAAIITGIGTIVLAMSSPAVAKEVDPTSNIPQIPPEYKQVQSKPADLNIQGQQPGQGFTAGPK